MGVCSPCSLSRSALVLAGGAGVPVGQHSAPIGQDLYVQNIIEYWNIYIMGFLTVSQDKKFLKGYCQT